MSQEKKLLCNFGCPSSKFNTTKKKTLQSHERDNHPLQYKSRMEARKREQEEKKLTKSLILDHTTEYQEAVLQKKEESEIRKVKQKWDVLCEKKSEVVVLKEMDELKYAILKECENPYRPTIENSYFKQNPPMMDDVENDYYDLEKLKSIAAHQIVDLVYLQQDSDFPVWTAKLKEEDGLVLNVIIYGVSDYELFKKKRYGFRYICNIVKYDLTSVMNTDCLVIDVNEGHIVQAIDQCVSFSKMQMYFLNMSKAVLKLYETQNLHLNLNPYAFYHDSSGNVKLCDYPFVELHNNKYGQSVLLAISTNPKFKAKETYDGRHSTKSDVYSLGMVFLFLLMNKSFRQEFLLYKIQLFRPGDVYDSSFLQKAISFLEDVMHKELKDLIVQMIQEDDEKRPTMNQVIDSISNLPIPSESDLTIPSRTKRKRKDKISHITRTQIWDAYIGMERGKVKCPYCQVNDITQMNFEAGHVIAEAEGGEATVENLRPICNKCNKSLGKTQLDLEKYQVY